MDGGELDLLSCQACIVVSPLLTDLLSLILRLLAVPVLEVLLGRSSIGFSILSYQSTDTAISLVGLTMEDGVEGVASCLFVGDELGIGHCEDVRDCVVVEESGVITRRELQIGKRMKSSVQSHNDKWKIRSLYRKHRRKRITPFSNQPSLEQVQTELIPSFHVVLSEKRGSILVFLSNENEQEQAV